jgi:iron complex transport system substrate-binding protein
MGNIGLRMDKPAMQFRYLGILLVTLAVLGLSFGSFHGLVSANASDGFPISIVDDFGRNVTIQRMPERIVSLSPSCTEILFAVGAGPNVVGVTSYCDYPPEVLVRVKDGTLKIVGGFSDPNIEIIVGLGADLIVASSDLQGDIVSSMESKGLTVVGLMPKTVDDIVEDVRLVGRIVGEYEPASRLAESMRDRIDVVLNKTERALSRPRVYYEVWYDPLMSVGQGTYINDLVAMAGGVNIFSASSSPYPVVNSETIIEANPEVIFVAKGYMGLAIEETSLKMKDRPGWKSIDAIKHDRIFEIEEDIVYRHGPRIVDGLETMAQVIHPELFPQTAVHRLVIQTSPAVSGVAFEIDGLYERADSGGVLSQLLKKGTHTVKILNSTFVVNGNRLQFLGWSGVTSAKDQQVSLNISSDSVLTANYYTLTNASSGSRPWLTYVLVMVAVVAVLALAAIAVKVGFRHREIS